MTSHPAALLHTPQLDLVPGTVELAEAELAGLEGFAALLGCDVPASWPPGEYDRGAIAYLRDRILAGGPNQAGWYTWYGITRGPSGARGLLVTAGGYLGPPAEGLVEIGYSVVPEARGRGLATELARSLAGRAFGFPDVAAVIAHTVDSNPASSRVLGRCGFRRVGPGAEAGTVQYRLDRPA